MVFLNKILKALFGVALLSSIFFLQDITLSEKKIFLNNYYEKNIEYKEVNSDNIKLSSMGNYNVLADFMWIKLVLTIGGRGSDEKTFYDKNILQYVKSISNIIPKFKPLYRSILIIFPSKNNPINNELIGFGEKGLKELNNDGEIAGLIGYIYLFYLDDEENALKYYKIAKDNNPLDGYKMTYNTLLLKKGKFEVALQMWKTYYKQSLKENDDNLRRLSEVKIKKLKELIINKNSK